MQKYRFNEEWEKQEIEGDAILYNQKSNMVMTINNSGNILLEILSRSSCSFDHIIDEFSKIFKIESELETDVETALHKFIELGVILCIDNDDAIM